MYCIETWNVLYQTMVWYSTKRCFGTVPKCGMYCIKTWFCTVSKRGLVLYKNVSDLGLYLLTDGNVFQTVLVIRYVDTLGVTYGTIHPVDGALRVNEDFYVGCLEIGKKQLPLQSQVEYRTFYFEIF